MQVPVLQSAQPEDTMTRPVVPMFDAVYNRFFYTPAVKESVILMDRIRREGPAAIADQAEVLRGAWRDVGKEHMPTLNWSYIENGISWFLGRRPLVTRLDHRAVYRLHELTAPDKAPHQYDKKEEQTVYVDVLNTIKVTEWSGRLVGGPTQMKAKDVDRVKDRIIYICPERRHVPALMKCMFDLVRPLAIPIANALLHLNMTAIHPFYDGNSHLRTALTLGQAMYATHPSVVPHILPVLKKHWDGFFSGYEQAWRNAVGPAYEPERDVTSWVEWYVTAEARLMALAAVAAQSS